MRNLLAMVGLIVVAFIAVGWFRGWYTFSLTPSADGKQRITVDVDTKKLSSDGQHSTQRVGEFIDGFRKPAETTTTATTSTPTVAPAGSVSPLMPVKK